MLIETIFSVPIIHSKKQFLETVCDLMVCDLMENDL